MQKNELRIDILGTEITISADEEPEYLDRLLDKYKRNIEDIQNKTGLKDPLKTAILTGFLLCDDLEKAKTEQSPGEAEQLTMGMISRLDEIVLGKEILTNETPAPIDAEPNSGKTTYFLKNIIKNYDWGSSDLLPDFMNRKNPDRIPWAELWMGVNLMGPSQVTSYGGTGKSLLDVIDQDKENLLGKETAGKYGTLPFLYKVLAVEKPLSIQAHPNIEQARAGFERENREGKPLDAPNRNYRDSNHKPEILCALGPFTALCGFREEREIRNLVEILSIACGDGLKTCLDRLFSALNGENSLKDFLAVLYDIGSETLKIFGAFIKTEMESLEKDFPEYKDEWELCVYLSNIYPGDPGILAPLFLNIIKLENGEAIFIPQGVFHSYIKGMGIELMADSDNVLRGGLTSKYVDREELFKILNFSEYKPEIMKAPDHATPYYTYPTPCEEFSLSVMLGESGHVSNPYPEKGPSIMLVTDGFTVVPTGEAFSPRVNKGMSIFIPAGMDLKFSWDFTAYIASVPV
ncbi:MAG: mannose-6-phosphate isomerase, class I [Treponema sp.]|jgi:mannose-6-phosphate isomerase|nr:mannose-6-phosphate isomerase, class I [Treponema sp.]